MNIINEASFSEVTRSGVVLVDFFATWCGPCKMLGPVLEQLAPEFEGKAQIVKVDVDNDQALAMRYNIMSVPTMLLFKNGEVVKQIQGFQPKEVLANEIKALL